MNLSGQNSNAGSSSAGDFEATLKLIARLAPPQGLEDRVAAGLHAAPASSNARILAWPVTLRPGSVWMRSAAAAAIVAVVIGGSWGVYSRVQPVEPARAITAPPRVTTQGGFSSAGAMRTPQTLNGPMVEHPAAAKPATVAPLPNEPAAKPAVKTLAGAAKTGAASKAIAHPAAAPAK